MATIHDDELEAYLRRPTTPRRVAAYAIDLVVLALIAIVYWVVLDMAELGNAPWDGGPTARTRIGAVILDLGLTLIGAGYFIGCWHQAQQTVGMRALGLHVEREDDRDRLSVGECVVRWLVLEGILTILAVLLVSGEDPLSVLIDWAGLAWALVILVSVVRDPLRRGFHDQVSGSIVIAER